MSVWPLGDPKRVNCNMGREAEFCLLAFEPMACAWHCGHSVAWVLEVCSPAVLLIAHLGSAFVSGVLGWRWQHVQYKGSIR